MEKLEKTKTAGGLKFNQIYQGDCLDLFRYLKERSVDLVVTDPFYGSSGRDGSVHLENDVVYGNRMSSDSFIWFVRKYSKELFRVTKEYSHCYVFSDWRKFKDVQISFETNGWELKSLIVWNKGNGMGEFWRSCHEFILFFTKKKPRKLTHGGCLNVINCKGVKNKEKVHSTEKPVELFKFLIEASSYKNELVLDPFAGSGTIAKACLESGRKYLGFEIEPENIKLSINKKQFYNESLL